MKRVYYKIRFPANIGRCDEWHSSKNGTEEWGSLAKVKAIITRGIRGGYKGRVRTEFENYEIVKVTETVKIEHEIVELPK